MKTKTRLGPTVFRKVLSLRGVLPCLLAALSLTATVPWLAPSWADAQSGSTYYVATDGIDSNPGTLSRPWASISYAATVMQPGDKVFIRSGLYEEGVQTQRAGLPTSPITFAAFPGEAPILDGSAVGDADGFSVGVGHAHIVVEGLKIQNFSRYAMVLWGNNHHVEVRETELVGSDVGLKLTDVAVPGAVVDDVWLVGIDVHDNRGAGVACSPGPCRNVRIHYSAAHSNGSYQDASSDGFGFEAGEHVYVQQSRATDNGGSGFDIRANDAQIVRSLSAENALSGLQLWGEDNVVENCILHDNSRAGLVLQGSGPYTVTNSIIAHNALQTGSNSLVAGPESSAGLSLRLYNSVFAFNGGAVFFGEGVWLQSDHNIYFSQEASEIQAAFTSRYNYSRIDLFSGIWFLDTGNGRHSASVDPKFVSDLRRDYHSQEGAPPIDAGSNDWAPAIDYDGIRRPQGQGVDIGAFEYWQRTRTNWLPLVAHR